MSESVELLKKIVALKKGGEVREQQETAVAEIEDAILTKTSLLLEAPTGSGKALDIDTPILTVDGWKTMGTLTTGDKVYDETGSTTNVTAVLDEFTGEHTYRLTFSNGEQIVADAEHLWSVRALGNVDAPHIDNNRLKVIQKKKISFLNPDNEAELDVRELATSISYPLEAVEAAATEIKPVEETETTVLYDSELLLETMYKHFLGRSITRTTEELSIGFRDDITEEYLWGIPTPEPVTFTVENRKLPAPPRLVGEWFAGIENVFSIEQFAALKETGVETNQRIPEEYMYASVLQRREFLTGLLEGNRMGSFITALGGLAQDVVTLASSLGLHAKKISAFDEQEGVFQFIVDISEEKYLIIENIELINSHVVRCITVDSENHLFLAGRTLVPTHNTLSYLIPLAQTETTAVVSTATKQLSEQIFDDDIPFVQNALKQSGSTKTLNAALLKGRDNYLCLAKLADVEKLTNDANALFGSDDLVESDLTKEGKQRVSEGKQIGEWAATTKTGDRSQAPAVGDDTWRQYSSTNAECPGKTVCPFGDVCFAEYARDKAKNAQIVITNHAIVAQDLANDGRLLGDREVFIFDELHELDNYLSSAWGAELSVKRLRDAHKIFKAQPAFTESAVADLLTCAETFTKVMKSMEVGLIDNEDAPRTLATLLTTLYNATTRISADAQRELKNASGEGAKKLLTGAKKIADELNEMASLLIDDSIETVRWTVDKNKTYVRKTVVKRGAKRKPAPVKPLEASEDSITLHAAPLRIGPKLQNFLADREAIMIGTSATITIGHKFEIPVHNFGLDKIPHKTIELDSPFDYRKQAMFYVPTPGTFPEPTGADRAEHSAAVKEQSAEFVKAAGGRALILSTTAYGANDIANSLRDDLPKLDFIAQGDAPNSQLVKFFREHETTSLIGTMGFWHGLDAPGKTLSLVIIDKLPFKPMDDPLATARRNYADRIGRNGFNDVYVADAETMFRQAFGRAIRSRSDRAVIVSFDVRLLTKNYGRGILNNLHGVGVYHDKEKVLQALRRLAEAE